MGPESVDGVIKWLYTLQKILKVCYSLNSKINKPKTLILCLHYCEWCVYMLACVCEKNCKGESICTCECLLCRCVCMYLWQAITTLHFAAHEGIISHGGRVYFSALEVRVVCMLQSHYWRGPDILTCGSFMIINWSEQSNFEPCTVWNLCFSVTRCINSLEYLIFFIIFSTNCDIFFQTLTILVLIFFFI